MVRIFPAMCSFPKFPEMLSQSLIYAIIRGGSGMKYQVLVGYQVPVFKKIQVPVESGLGPRKTLPENTCITSEVIHRHKGLEYVSKTTPNFPWPQNCSAFLSCYLFQIDQYCL